MATRTFYVTTPIYYVTARPHLGSLYSTVLADVAARWHMMKGERVFLLTGTDEHGQKVAQAARADNKEPRAFVEQFIAAFQDTWALYNINVSHFIRTTDQAHIQAVQAWIIQLQQQGDIYQSMYEGFYCTPCETFVMDRDVAQGTDPLCSSCGRETIRVSEPCYFFRLSAYADRLITFYEQHPSFIIPHERMAEVVSFVKSGLRDLAISRSRTAVSWGIPFPGDETQVVYVWADALNNYLSAVGYADPARSAEFLTWWPAQLQVLGKDIIRFHAVYWPAFLMAAGLPLPQHLLVHGWIKVQGAKMSKSLGNVVDPLELYARYGTDTIRYYLTRHIAVTHDAPFSIEELEQRANADLANDVGNLVQRVIKFTALRGITICTAPNTLTETEQQLWKELQQICRAAAHLLDICMFHSAYTEVWKGFALLNAYMQGSEPWKLSKDEVPAMHRIIGFILEALVPLAACTWPVMPHTMERLYTMIGVSPADAAAALHNMLSGGGEFQGGRRFPMQPSDQPLFAKYEIAVKLQSPLVQNDLQQMQDKNLVSIDDFGRIELRVGTIIAVDTVPKSDKLYKLTVDFGTEGVRTICSGVRAHFLPEDLLHTQGIFVTNLAPRVMMGITSQGMMLFVEGEDKKFKLVSPRSVVPNGIRLR